MFVVILISKSDKRPNNLSSIKSILFRIDIIIHFLRVMLHFDLLTPFTKHINQPLIVLKQVNPQYTIVKFGCKFLLYEFFEQKASAK
jgi:hypothetical protein